MELKENEKVLFELELTENRKEEIYEFLEAILFLFLGFFIFFFVVIPYFVWEWSISKWSWWILETGFLYFIIFLFVILMLIFYPLLENTVRFSRSKYYLTNRRVVRILGKGWLYRRKSRRSIELSRVSFFRSAGDNILYIIELQKDGTPHYTGNEEDRKKVSFRNRIKIKPFMSEREKEKREEFRDHLIDALNAAQHPHLDDIYVPKRYLKEEEEAESGASIKEKILKKINNEKFLSIFMGCLTVGIFFCLMCLSLTARSIEFLEIMLLELLLIGSLFQYLSLDCLKKAFSDHLNGKVSRTQQVKDHIIFFGFMISLVSMFILILYWAMEKWTPPTPLWFPLTIYVGLPGLWRWWFSRGDQGEGSIFNNVLKIEGLLTFTYSVLLISLGPFFLEFSILRMLSAFPLLSGGISSNLLGIFGEWEEEKNVSPSSSLLFPSIIISIIIITIIILMGIGKIGSW